MKLKDAWIAKLKDRYDKNPTDKNFKAWKNAEDRFSDNITELMHDVFDVGLITKMNYDLISLIDSLRIFSKRC